MSSDEPTADAPPEDHPTLRQRRRDRLQAEARRVRKLADGMKGTETQEQLLQIAAIYEALSERSDP